MAMGPEDKKKAYLLGGVAGVLGIVGLVVLRPWAGSSDTATPTPTAVASTTGADNSAGGAGGAPPTSPAGGPGAPVPSGAGGAPAEGAGAAGGAQPQFVAVENFRQDPFVPFYTIPAAQPEPPRRRVSGPGSGPGSRPRPRPTPLPPLNLPQPGEDFGGGFGGDSAGFGGGRGGETTLPPLGNEVTNSRSNILSGLPQARVSRLVSIPTTPRVQTAPVNQGGGTPVLERSTNKRLAGVAIGDSVRALLEVQDPVTGEFRTYIVQPGQRVDAENIQVLRIERTTENNQTRVRMVVRENGEVRLVELREGQRTDIAGAGGAGGYPGGAPAGNPGGFIPPPGFGGPPGLPGGP